MTEIIDRLNLQRVANGWVVTPGGGHGSEAFTHVYVTPKDLAAHVEKWAQAQIVAPALKRS